MAQYKLSYSNKWSKVINANAGSVSANSYLDVDLVTGLKIAKVGDIFIVVAPSLDGGLTVSPGIVTVAGTITVRLTNATASPINPAALDYIVVAL